MKHWHCPMYQSEKLKKDCIVTKMYRWNFINAFLLFNDTKFFFSSLFFFCSKTLRNFTRTTKLFTKRPEIFVWKIIKPFYSDSKIILQLKYEIQTTNCQSGLCWNDLYKAGIKAKSRGCFFHSWLMLFTETSIKQTFQFWAAPKHRIQKGCCQNEYE